METLGKTQKAFVVNQEDATVRSLLDRAIALYPDRLAYILPDGQELTFSELGDRVDRSAKALIALGVQKGDRVAIWMSNCEEWITIYLGLARIGGVLVPVNTSLSIPEAAYVVRHSGAKILVVKRGEGSRDLVAEAAEVLKTDGVVASPIVVGSANKLRATEWNDVLSHSDQVDTAVYEARQADVRQEDVLLTMYTSGSTGFPKGVVHSHKFVRNMIDVADRLRINSDDRVVLYLPLFHVFGAAAVMTFLYAGGAIILMSRFDARASLELMEKHHATVVYGINTMANDQIEILESEKFDLNHVRVSMVPGSVELLEQLEKHFHRAVNLYGMTESTSVTSLPDLDDDFETRSQTAGYPMPGFEVKIVDKNRNEVEPGVVGELAVRGHPVMLGYYNAPEQTAAAMDDDGWFYTEDALLLREDGYLEYVTRFKDVYKVGGENVTPSEVESVIQQHPAVHLCAVVGEPDVRLGFVGVAFIQLKNGFEVTSDELLELARANLARFKVPRRIEFVSSMPMTASGKIQKYKLLAE